MKIKMLVQSQYKKALLRAGQIYDIHEETARRWILSKIAEAISESEAQGTE